MLPDAYAQKPVTLPIVGDVTVTELDAFEALKFGAVLGSILAASLDGVDGGQLRVGKAARGALDKLLEKPEHLIDLVRTSVVSPTYTDEWFRLTFRATNLPALYELLHAIIIFNYGPIAELLKKKAPFAIDLSFLGAGDTTAQP